MRNRAILSTVAVASVALASGSFATVVRIETPAGAAVTAEVIAECESTAMRWRLVAPVVREVTPPREKCRFSVSAPGLWASVVEGRDLEQVVFSLAEAGRVTADVTGLDRQAGMHPQIQPWVRRPPAQVWERSTLCRYLDPEDKRVECSLPVGQVDVLFRVPGHAPVPRLDVAVSAAASSQLATLRFVAGAWITGSVDWPRSAGGGATPVVELVPMSGSAPGIPAEVATSSGEFLVEGVQDGSYLLKASAGKGLEATVGPIPVQGAREHRLEQPLRIHHPVPYEVIVQPAAQPSGEAWRVRLRPLTADGHTAGTSAEVESRDGSALFPAVSPGLVEIGLMGKTGSWLIREEEVGARGGTSVIDLPLVEVVGEVSSREEGWKVPAPARVELLQLQSGANVGFTVDEEGGFRGFLPRPGSWAIRFAAPGISHRLGERDISSRTDGRPTELAIVLGAGILRGRVETPDGLSRRATVKAFRITEAGREQVLSQRTYDDGTFEIQGLPQDRLVLFAESLLAERSAHVPVDLSGGPYSEDLVLVVREGREVTGRVVAGGAPVTQGLVKAWPVGTDGTLVGPIEKTFIAPDGSFSLILPPQRHALLVLSPPFPLTLRRIDVGELDQQSHVELAISTQTGTLTFVVKDEGGQAEQRFSAFRMDGIEVPLAFVFEHLRPDDGSPTAGSIHLETGAVELCRDRREPSSCATGSITEGGRVIFTLGG